MLTSTSQNILSSLKDSTGLATTSTAKGGLGRPQAATAGKRDGRGAGGGEKSLESVLVSLDVSFEGPGHKGLEAIKITTSLIEAQPSLRPLVLVLKCFLTRRSLCEGFTGGLSSYALLLMTGAMEWSGAGVALLA